MQKIMDHYIITKNYYIQQLYKFPIMLVIS